LVELSAANWAKYEDRLLIRRFPMTDTLPEDRRRDVFAAIVAAQDGGLKVAASHKHVAAEYGITTAQVQVIEREGLEAQWPPLDS